CGNSEAAGSAFVAAEAPRVAGGPGAAGATGAAAGVAGAAGAAGPEGPPVEGTSTGEAPHRHTGGATRGPAVAAAASRRRLRSSSEVSRWAVSGDRAGPAPARDGAGARAPGSRASEGRLPASAAAARTPRGSGEREAPDSGGSGTRVQGTRASAGSAAGAPPGPSSWAARRLSAAARRENSASRSC
ncbi:hypothetical protein H696_05638, partial [Fonticula alba]